MGGCAETREEVCCNFKWIYKIKHAIDGSIEKQKESFVEKFFSNKEGIDYEETFSPMVSYTSIRTIVSLEIVMKWKVHEMDVKTIFLNNEVEEQVYVE